MVPSALKHAAHNVHHYPRLSVWMIFWLLWIAAFAILGGVR